MTSAMSVPVYELPTVPVVQPPHLEGDASLATEILPGPPSLTAVRQSGLAHRRDPKKPGVSYLPASDPGTTYSGHSVAAMTSALETDGAPKRKRARVDKGSAANRAQRASARNVNAAPSFSSDAALGAKSAPSSPPLVPDSDSASVQMDAEPLPPLSRSNSLLNVDETVANGKGGKREKGKGKEKEKTGLRVKEEPVNVALPPADQAPNEDHCSSCRSLGALVYCDGCPRAFHLWCLNPPMEPGDLPEGDARWFCPNCSIRQNPPPQPPPSVLAPVIQQVQTSIPIEFQLPDDIRGFFKDVASNARGGYVDASEIKQPRLNRHGQLEDRDPYRLKDRNGAPVLCFRCGMSALPDDAAAHSPAVKRARKLSGADCKAGVWKSIVSCDYCDLHFHLDCLDPPLPSMPSFGKKWMCPNHAEHVIQPKRRIPKHNAPPIDISRPNQWNNGNIEIIQSEPVSAVPKVSVDEVMINGRRYRVPEKVVVLDFWNKVKNHGQHRREFEIPSTASSPLTTLSELDMDDTASSHPNTAQPDEEDIRIAELLCGLRVTAPQAGQGSSTAEKHDAGSSAVNGNAGDASKRRRTAGTSHKAAAEKPPAPRRTERRNARASAPSNVNELPKLEQDDTDYLPTAGPSKAQHAPAPQKTSPEDGEGSARPRRSGRVPQPRRKSPIPTRLASRESFTATSEGKPTPSEKPLAKSTPPAPPAAPPSMPTSSISENPQPQPPNSQSLKIRLPRLNAIGLSSNPAPPSVSAPLSQPSTINSAGRPERHKAPASESQARRSSRRRTSTAASAAGSPSPSKLSSRNIAV